MIALLSMVCAAAAAGPDAGLLARPIEVSADRLELFNREGRAVYSGHAKAIRDSTTVRCERLTVFFGAGPDAGASREVMRIEAEGAVEATDGDRRVTGRTARYDNLTGLLVVEGEPQVSAGPRHVSGQTVRFTTGSERLEVLRARTVAPDELTGRGTTLLIDADRLVLEGRNQAAVWTGNVRAERGTTRLQTAELIAHADPAGAVTRLQARGAVQATDKDKWVKGERADYDNLKGVLVVTGHPEATQGPNRIKGSKVTFVTGKDTVEVENAVTTLAVEKKP